MALSLTMHVLVIYVPFLQTAFHTAPLSSFDWAVATGVAGALLIGMEVIKAALRIKRRAARGAAGGALREESPSHA